MSSAEQQIRELLLRAALSISDGGHLLTQVRIALEERKWQDKYPHVNFYCNWVLHARLSRSALCYTILEQIADALLAYDFGGGESIERKVGETLSTERLREEFVDLFGKLDLPADVFLDRATWKGLRGHILFLVLDKPLSFPDKRALARPKNRKIKAIYDKVQQRSKTQGLVIREFSLTTWRDNVLRWRILADAGEARDLTITGLVADP